jgi:hypothetical protein
MLSPCPNNALRRQKKRQSDRSTLICHRSAPVIPLSVRNETHRFVILSEAKNLKAKYHGRFFTPLRSVQNDILSIISNSNGYYWQRFSTCVPGHGIHVESHTQTGRIGNGQHAIRVQFPTAGSNLIHVG